VIKAGALCSWRVVLRADLNYYGPLGLPLPSIPFRHRLIETVFARRGLSRRVSHVPAQTLRACNFPYPGKTRRSESDCDLADVAFAVT